MKILNKIKTTTGIIKLFKNWLYFLLCYAGIIKKKDAVLRFRNGLTWHVDTTKRGFAVLGDVWLQKPYELLLKIKDPKIIIDLGAHIGSFSIMAATTFPQARVYAFEASRENFALLKKNIEENKIKNIIANKVGVSTVDGMLDFFIDEKNTVLNSFIKTRQASTLESYKVKCRRLSTIFSDLKIRECDFLKLDIEGLERSILESALHDKILNKIRALVTEIEPDSPNFKETLNLLSHHGFIVSTKKDIINAVRRK